MIWQYSLTWQRCIPHPNHRSQSTEANRKEYHHFLWIKLSWTVFSNVQLGGTILHRYTGYKRDYCQSVCALSFHAVSAVFSSWVFPSDIGNRSKFPGPVCLFPHEGRVQSISSPGLESNIEAEGPCTMAGEKAKKAHPIFCCKHTIIRSQALHGVDKRCLGSES